MKRVGAISLDVTGTLVDGRCVKHFWDHLIPAAYAAENNICFEEAYLRVKKKYNTISRDDVRWYMPEYWLRELNISVSLEKLLQELKSRVVFFPDVAPMITRFKSEYVLIVSSNLPVEILQTVLEDFKECFSKVFSSVSKYGLPYKTAEFYAKVCSETGFTPATVLHVGDSKTYDLLIPRIIGMGSLLIRRFNKPEQRYEVNSLEQVAGSAALEAAWL
jgi:FMN phosphatase YigB (HAD superfamily)